MTYRRWFLLTLLSMATATLAVAASSYAIDLFGVFREARGRSLQLYNNERTGKFLLNQRYVPENFGALLIGSSLTSNWDVSALGGPRMYNESMDGANATEEKLLVDQALANGHFRYALCVLSPAMTPDHSLKEGGMGTPGKFEALGSISILREEVRGASDRLLHRQRRFFADGSKILEETKRDGAWFPPMWSVDAQGVRDYEALLAELRGRGVHVIFVEPPISAPVLAQRQAALQQYLASVALVHEGEPVIDFNSPQYSWFRGDAGNYYDDVHLTPRGAETITGALAEELSRIRPQSPEN